VKVQKTSSLDAAKKESSGLQKQVTDLQEQLTKAESAAQVSPDVLLSCRNTDVMPMHAPAGCLARASMQCTKRKKQQDCLSRGCLKQTTVATSAQKVCSACVLLQL